MADRKEITVSQNALELSRELTQISQLSGSILLSQARKLQLPNIDPLNLKRPLWRATMNTLRHPQRILQAQWDLTRRYFGLLRYLGFRVVGMDTDPAAEARAATAASARKPGTSAWSSICSSRST